MPLPLPGLFNNIPSKKQQNFRMPKPEFWKNRKRYYDFKSFLANRFGCRVYKIQIDAGFTCPNRDGTIAVGG